VQRRSAHPEWILEALIWASTVAVQGHTETMDAELGHQTPFYRTCV